ncbi:MAG: hypothetical protein ACIALR_02345 [Blastopirellula sp. JB062]
MHKLVSTSLIFFLLLGQTLVAAPHLHLDHSDAMPASHSVRSHVHLHSDSHHASDQSHAHHDEAPANPCSGEHDEDAVYLGDVDLAGVSSTNLLLELPVLPYELDRTVSLGVLSGDRGPIAFGDLLQSQRALYAQLLSIRC